MYFAQTLFACLFFFIGIFVLTALQNALTRMHKRNSQKAFSASGKFFFYHSLQHAFFPKQGYEGIVSAVLLILGVVRFAYIISVFFLFQQLSIYQNFFDSYSNIVVGTLFFICFVFLSFFLGEYLPRLISNKYPYGIITVCSGVASIFLTVCFPLIILFFCLQKILPQSLLSESSHNGVAEAKQEIMDIIQEANLSVNLDINDKKLIASVLKYREHIVREVMVPRVDVFSLSADTSIKEAAQKLEEEGYSRTPIWRNSVDNIVGVLMYKDILTKYMEYEQKKNDSHILEASIESISKPPLYTPETKRISTLLQEFRKKQVHMAIVVDEYGGTEGIVTIEDILEQIVGEIADEYDEDEEMFFVQNDGSWIVDARMNILDAEEQLGILVPQDGDYDTIGGYIYHRAGTIPSKGFVIKHDDFELEVLRSSERCVEKVRITPIKH